MFYWFFPALKPKVKNPPLIIWLQGGPGASSMIGLFYEAGPIHVTEDLRLMRNNNTWANEYSMLFVEQPVGTGYSFVNQNAMYTKLGYVKDQRAVVRDMLVFLDQFYERYPEQQKADLYIVGQSYAGKFIPSIAHAIMERNRKIQSKLPQSARGGAVIPIKGISMGNSMTDPITQIQIHADHAFYLGLLTTLQADQMREYQRNAVKLVEQGRFLDANRFRGKIFNLFRNSTGQLNTFDIRKGSHGMNWKPMTALLNRREIKDSLNVFGPRKTYLLQQKVKQAMRGDIMRSTKPLVADLLDNGIKVLAYQGIFDFRDAPVGSTRWIEEMEWKGREEFGKTERRVWKVGGFTAGYVNSVMRKGKEGGGGLTRVVVLGGGHYTPMDESENSLVMIRHLIDGIPLEG
ncbi:Alpha/Beta hydrolase protein [Linnemannia elongata]|nr:Alpha/Beta hydrolase protein [Linnemannia elongata]